MHKPALSGEKKSRRGRLCRLRHRRVLRERELVSLIVVMLILVLLLRHGLHAGG